MSEALDLVEIYDHYIEAGDAYEEESSSEFALVSTTEDHRASFTDSIEYPMDRLSSSAVRYSGLDQCGPKKISMISNASFDPRTSGTSFDFANFSFTNARSDSILPDHLLMKVLSYLPLLDLWKSCRAVSGHWRTLSGQVGLSDEYVETFCQLHLRKVQIPSFEALKDTYCTLRCQGVNGTRATLQVVPSAKNQSITLISDGSRQNQLWFQYDKQWAISSNNEEDVSLATITLDFCKVYNLLCTRSRDESWVHER